MTNKLRVKRRTAKNKKNRFLFAIGLGILVSFILALAHNLFGINLIQNMGEDAILTLDMYVFFLSGVAVFLVSLTYWYFVRDLSESLAILLTGAWALGSGLEDIFVYLQLGRFPEVYPWLNGTPAGFLAGIFGTEVTTTMLFLNSLVLGLVLVGILYALYKFEIEFYGVRV